MEWSAAEMENYHRDGYLHIKNFWNEKQVLEIKNHMEREYVNTLDVKNVPISIFTTNEQARTTDDYFLESGNKISYFFEEKAIRKSKDSVEFLVDKRNSINKIGHALHKKDALFSKYSTSNGIKTILRDLKYEKPAIVQSMYIFKQPRIGGTVSVHQDGTFLKTEPQSVIGFWWALEDCTEQNGCLWGVPGSHRKVDVEQHFKRDEKNGVNMTPRERRVPYDTSSAVPILAKKGDLILIHHSFVHFSHENTSKNSRHAYTMHVLETKGTEYPKDNWLQVPEDDPFTSLYA